MLPMNRRCFLLYGCHALWGLGFGYAHAIEPTWFELNVHNVSFRSRIRKKVRILHLSDLHYSEDVPLSVLSAAFSLGLAQKPDIICITGDFTTIRLPEISLFRAELSRLSSAAPTFACMGNHDGGKWLKDFGGYEDSQEMRSILQSSGIRVLHNQREIIYVSGQMLCISGVGDWWADELDVGAFGQDSHLSSAVTIMLSHNPDTKDQLESLNWDLMLSGHTHGGEVIMPFIDYAPFAPVQDRGYVSGLNLWKDRLIHTSKGVGTSSGFRFNCRPEVAIIELHGV